MVSCKPFGILYVMMIMMIAMMIMMIAMMIMMIAMMIQIKMKNKNDDDESLHRAEKIYLWRGLKQDWAHQHINGKLRGKKTKVWIQNPHKNI